MTDFSDYDYDDGEGDLESIPFFLVVGREAVQRRATGKVLRAMAKGRKVDILAGDSPDLEDRLDHILEHDDCVFFIIDLPAQASPTTLFERLDPLIAEGEIGFAVMLTVLDAAHFWPDFMTGDDSVAQTLVGTIEWATIVLVANSHHTPPDDVLAVEGFARKLNDLATVMRLEDLKRLSLEAFIDLANGGPLSEDGEAGLAPGDDDPSGFSSFHWTSSHRLDRDRLLAILGDLPEEVLRVKGRIRFGDGMTAEVSRVRSTLAIDEVEDDVARDAIESLREGFQELLEDADEPWGDADDDIFAALETDTVLTFVGRNLDAADLAARLATCEIDAP